MKEELADSKIKYFPKKNKEKKILTSNLFNPINKNNIIDEFQINKNFNFDKNNIQYSWIDENHIIEYEQKKKKSIKA